MAEFMIYPLTNGPNVVRGPVKVIDATGKEIVRTEPFVYFCRCGGSSNKPFCDSTHRKNNFQAPGTAHPK